MSITRFHAVHGDRVQISGDKTEARLLQDGSEVGVVFSAKCLVPNEKVCLSIEVPTGTNRHLTFGFTNQNPITLIDEEQRRIWKPYLVEIPIKNKDVLHICVYPPEEVHYGFYWEFSSRYFSGVDITRLWLLVHLPCAGSLVRFVEPRVCPQFLRGFIQNLRPLTFHRVRGKAIAPSNGTDYHIMPILRSTMRDHDRYAFSARPIQVNEKVCFYTTGNEVGRSVIQIGFTNYDPAFLSHSVKLKDESTYWLQTVVLSNTNFSMYFYVNSFRELYVGGYDKLEYKLIPKITISSPLWAFFNILTNISVISANAIYTSETYNYSQLKDSSHRYVRPVTNIRLLQTTNQEIQSQLQTTSQVRQSIPQVTSLEIQSGPQTTSQVRQSITQVTSQEIQSGPLTKSQVRQSIPQVMSLEIQSGPPTTSQVRQSITQVTSQEIQSGPQTTSQVRQSIPQVTSLEIQSGPLTTSQVRQSIPQVTSLGIQSGPQTTSQVRQSIPQVTSLEIQSGPQTMSQARQSIPQVTSLEIQSGPQTTSQVRQSILQVTSLEIQSGPQTMNQVIHLIPQVTSQERRTANELYQSVPQTSLEVEAQSVPQIGQCTIQSISHISVPASHGTQPISQHVQYVPIFTNQDQPSPSSQSIMIHNMELNSRSSDNQAQMDVPGSSRHQLTSNECIICCEGPANTAFVTCGHQCSCYDCAINVWLGQGGARCPICRASIDQILRVYNE